MSFNYSRWDESSPEKDSENNNGSPGYLINFDYYRRPFSLLHDELARTKYRITTHQIRRRFWRLLQPRIYSSLEARPLLLQYLKSIEQQLSSIIRKHSFAYWLHVYRRLAPGPVGSDDRPVTVGIVRATLEASIQKYAALNPCNGVGITTEISIDQVLGGLLMAPEFEFEREGLKKYKQLVLTNFTVQELKEIYDLENLAYEIWRTSAMLRIVGKGSPVSIIDDDRYYIIDIRSDELDQLVTNFDERSNLPSSTRTGVTYPEIADNENLEKMIFLPIYNLNRLTSEDFHYPILDLFHIKLDIPFIFNFLWFPFNLHDYRNAHVPFADAFESKYKTKLDAVLAIIAGLLYRVFFSWIQTEGKSFYRYSQRSYEGPVLRQDVIREIIGFKSAATEILGIKPGSLTNDDLYKAVEFWELNETKQNGIDIVYSGPHFLFVPYDEERIFIDYAWIHRRLYDLFFGVDLPDQNFKGDALENMVRYKKTALPSGKLKSLNGQEKQIDASFDLGDRLVIVECKAVGKSIAFERGDPKAIRFRIDLVNRMLQEADDKANWLVTHPVGTNYDIRQYQEILPLAVSPFVEYIPSLDSWYWLQDELPRVLTPKELKDALEKGLLLYPNKNIVQIS